MVNDPYVSVDENFHALYLGKAYEDLNEYEKSFNHYKEGNLIKKAKLYLTSMILKKNVQTR